MRRIVTEPIDMNALMRPADPGCGAVVVFIGVVRETADGRRVRGMRYSAYEEMAEAELERIVRDSAEPGALEIRIAHRIGWLKVGEIAVVVAARAAHRAEAFAACRRAIEAVKREVPIWKHEAYEDGGAGWVPGASAVSCCDA